MNEAWSQTLDELAELGELSPAWQPVFERVDRALFIPGRFWLHRPDSPPTCIDRADDPGAWKAVVYSDTPLLTKLDDAGGGISSSSQPSIMAIMLGALDVQARHRVLEVGAGTGYNAALLAEHVGPEHVATVEIDTEVAQAARASLKTAGYEGVHVMDGDGAHPPAGPWDRLIATYAVDSLPPAWLTAVTPGGVIVAPWRNNLLEQAVVRLVVRADGTASGTLVAGCSFMSDRRAWTDSQSLPEGGETERTRIGPEYLEAVPLSMWLSRNLPDTLLYKGPGRIFLHRAETDSFAVLDMTGPDEDGSWEVRQAGPCRLWDELEASLHAWFDAGQAGLDTWQVTVDDDGSVRLHFER